jgi:hypothetical protein
MRSWLVIHDIFDDDYWKGFDGRRNLEFAERFGSAMRRLDELSQRLTEEAYQEYLKREAQRTKDETDVAPTPGNLNVD